MFFKVEISEVAEKLDIAALSVDEQNSLFQGLVPDPVKHDVYRIMLAIVEREVPKTWNERRRKRKTFDLVDRVLVDMRPSVQDIRIVGVYPTTISSEGRAELDLEAQASAKILDVANATLRFSGPIKNWWRKKRPLIVSNRTDRLAQWVFSREWLDTGNQCQGEILCIVPKDLDEIARRVSCFADFKAKGGRAIEKARRNVSLPVSV